MSDFGRLGNKVVVHERAGPGAAEYHGWYWADGQTPEAGDLVAARLPSGFKGYFKLWEELGRGAHGSAYRAEWLEGERATDEDSYYRQFQRSSAQPCASLLRRPRQKVQLQHLWEREM